MNLRAGGICAYCTLTGMFFCSILIVAYRNLSIGRKDTYENIPEKIIQKV